MEILPETEKENGITGQGTDPCPVLLLTNSEGRTVMDRFTMTAAYYYYGFAYFYGKAYVAVAAKREFP